MKKTRKLISYIVAATIFIVSGSAIPKQVFATTTNNSVKVTILETSDVHGRFIPWDYALDAPNLTGSLTQLYSAVKSIRSENPNTILVDAGDSIQDNSVELFKNGPTNPMVIAMNEMGYDAWTMGNHEFNFGVDILKNTIAGFKGQALAGNIYNSDGSRFLPAYKIIEKEV